MHVYMCIHAHVGVGTRMGVVSVCMHIPARMFCMPRDRDHTCRHTDTGLQPR